MRKGDGGEEDRTNKIYNMRKKTRRNSVGKVESEECAYSWESLCRLIETRRLMFSSPLCSLLLQFPLFFLPLVSSSVEYMCRLFIPSRRFSIPRPRHTHIALSQQFRVLHFEPFFSSLLPLTETTHDGGGTRCDEEVSCEDEGSQATMGSREKRKKTQHNTRRV